jgi:hypothetical protein
MGEESAFRGYRVQRRRERNQRITIKLYRPPAGWDGWPTSEIRVPHLRDGFIVAKVGFHTIKRRSKYERVQSKFHDGFLDGSLIHDPQVIIFLRTDGNEAFTLGV